MASHMGVQSFATERNSQVEYFVHFVLEEFCAKLSAQGRLIDVQVESQQAHTSSIASDVWDHRVIAKQPNDRVVEIWCQTTCYKGNGKGTPEPNKTYEVRETLVEGISIRQKFEETPEIDYRTIHFTVGDSQYTYQWFLKLKAAIYDKSMYIGDKGYDIFTDISNALAGALTEENRRVLLQAEMVNKTILGNYLTSSINELFQWWDTDNHPKSLLADSQWALVKSELTAADTFANLPATKGMNIKGRTNNLIFSEEGMDTDPLIPLTAAKLLKKNPFLSAAIEVIANWSSFENEVQALKTNSHTLLDLLVALWGSPDPFRLIIRRLLLRIHSDGSIAYVQDRNIDGISEHNLYAGNHNKQQIESICKQICLDLEKSGVSEPDHLISAIHAKGKRLINQARWFEAKNGTELKPSFDYVELALTQAGFRVMSPSEAKFKAIGYHAEISTEKVRPYTNLKVIVDKSGKTLAVIKAKFFRTQEFPRRCKEEAFVGITLKYGYKSGQFAKRLSVPLIMFVDMAAEGGAPHYAVRRLAAFGWKVVFSIDELIAFLRTPAK